MTRIQCERKHRTRLRGRELAWHKEVQFEQMEREKIEREQMEELATIRARRAREAQKVPSHGAPM